MVSAVVIAALAAGAMAVPYKRDIVTDIDVVYATDVVTVYATEQATATATTTADAAPAPAETTTVSTAAHYGHHGGWSWTFTSQAASSTVQSSATYVAPTTTTSPTSTSIYVAPTTSSTSTSTSVYVAPTTSSTSTSIYVAPTTSSTTSVWVAPTTSSTTSVWVAPTSSAPAYSAPSSTSSTSTASAAPTDYAGIAVLHHNLHRANHSADPVAWSDDLAKSASDIAASCVYAHNVDADGGGYGQNIAAGVESANISAIITDLFYNGEVGWFAGLYGQAQPDMTNFEHWGHFSQIVWKDTKFIGCATQYCPNGLANVGDDVAPYFTVCNYKGPGNYANEYAANIGSPLNQATADWNTGLSL